jgi:Fic family protein
LLYQAKDSSAIENIVTTHDDLYRDSLFADHELDPAAKEVLRYRQALNVGFQAVRQSGLLTINHILAIQAELERNDAGFRKLPGTELKDGVGRTVYVPPQDHQAIVDLMRDLEIFVNNPTAFDADPLIKMAVIHHQFESVHPFYDGNGRTGRILNVLYLVKEELLDNPILYLSRAIVNTKADYYRLLQSVREQDAWEDWVLYMLMVVESTSRDAISTVKAIKNTLLETKHKIRDRHRFYSQDLVNSLFSHSYTKIDFLSQDLGVSRLTATRYLEELCESGLLEKRKIGRSNYYINLDLYSVLTDDAMR